VSDGEGRPTPTDADSTVAALKSWVRDFSRERDWEQFHHPKDLGVALACEVGELLEHVRYRTHEEVRAALAVAATHEAFAHELADCLWLVLRLGDVTGVDLAAALHSKLAEAARKYPVEKARGRADKYTAYRDEA
jgi:dCTP diphosphatase